MIAPHYPTVPLRLTVLMTCHNRRDRTLACLDSLARQTGVDHVAVRVVLVDDGSTDGTAAAVAERFPAVQIVTGNGSLYWCGGMRLAFRVAESPAENQPPADYHLWLNDDTILAPPALKTLLDTAAALRAGARASRSPESDQEPRQLAPAGARASRSPESDQEPRRLLASNAREDRPLPAIVAGACCDPRTGAPTYGGVRRCGQWPPLRFRLVAPGERPLPCETVNGNVVLVPREVLDAVGNLDEGFTHGVGDFDYGLRAARLGFRCFIAPGFVGQCARNPIRGSMRDASLPLRRRLALARRPTSMAPAREWMRLARRHTGWRWPLFWAEIVLSRVLLTWLWLWMTGQPPEAEENANGRRTNDAEEGK